MTLLVVTTPLLAQTSYTTNERVHLLGPIEKVDLQEAPYLDWYQKVYDRYTVDETALTQLNKYVDPNVKIDIYLGTWCGDSKREVTRFLKIVEQSAISLDQVNLIALDGRQENRKQGPNGEEVGKRIHRVPTFIFTQDGEEIGRIVEHPVTSLEIDAAQIYAGLAPRPNYRLSNYVLELFATQTTVEVDSLVQKNTRYLKQWAKNEHELNGLGYLLMSADRLEEAIVIFRLNTLLYPEVGNTFDSLGEGLLANGDEAGAITNYLKAIQLDPSNDGAIAIVEKIARKS